MGAYQRGVLSGSSASRCATNRRSPSVIASRSTTSTQLRLGARRSPPAFALWRRYSYPAGQAGAVPRLADGVTGVPPGLASAWTLAGVREPRPGAWTALAGRLMRELRSFVSCVSPARIGAAAWVYGQRLLEGRHGPSSDARLGYGRGGTVRAPYRGLGNQRFAGVPIAKLGANPSLADGHPGPCDRSSLGRSAARSTLVMHGISAIDTGSIVRYRRPRPHCARHRTGGGGFQHPKDTGGRYESSSVPAMGGEL